MVVGVLDRRGTRGVRAAGSGRSHDTDRALGGPRARSRCPRRRCGWAGSRARPPEPGADLFSTGAVKGGPTANLDSPRPPRIDRDEVVDHERDMRVVVQIAPLLRPVEAVTADGDRVALVVAVSHRHRVRLARSIDGRHPPETVAPQVGHLGGGEDAHGLGQLPYLPVRHCRAPGFRPLLAAMDPNRGSPGSPPQPAGSGGGPGSDDVVHQKCVQFLGPCQVLTMTKTVCTLGACGRRSVDVQPRCPATRTSSLGVCDDRVEPGDLCAGGRARRTDGRCRRRSGRGVQRAVVVGLPRRGRGDAAVG